jgi:hypothetical protein
VHPQSWAYAAGGNAAAGRVMEPRKLERRGPQAHPHGVARAKPTVCSGRPAAGLDAPRRGARTPPGSARGACLHKGAAGTWASPGSPWGLSGVGVPTVEGQTPGVARRRPRRTRALRNHGTPSQRRAPRYRGRSGSTARPREGLWAGGAEQSPAGRARARLVGQVGNRDPRDPLAGRRRRAARLLGGPLGETPGSPPGSLPRQSIAQQAKRSPAMGCHTGCHLRDRACVLAA